VVNGTPLFRRGGVSPPATALTEPASETSRVATEGVSLAPPLAGELSAVEAD